MLKKIFKCSVVAIVAIFVVPALFFVPNKNEEVYAEENKLSYEVILDKTDNNEEIDLSGYKIELEIGQDVFKYNGSTTISGSTFKSKTKSRIEYNGNSATIFSETNQVEIKDGEKEIVVDNNEIELLNKQSQVKANDCEFDLEEVAESLGYSVKKTKNKYILTREFFTKRLIVKSNTNIYDENAVKIVKMNNDYILSYETEKDTQLALEKFNKLKQVEYACADVVISSDEIQTDYSSTQQSYNFYTWGATVMGVEKYRDELSKYGTLNDVIVAVLDSGIDSDHDWFKNRIAPKGGSILYGAGFKEDDYEDEDGHGTHVSGTICELTPNNVKILPIKILDEEGHGYLSDGAYALDYLLSLNNSKIKVANMSFGGEVNADNWVHEFFKESIDNAKAKGIISVAAAGNETDDVANHCPANIDTAFTVGALKSSNGVISHADYSNFGQFVDISAPGSYIKGAQLGGGFTFKSGTSMAAPHVSGVVALMCLNPNKSYTPALIEKEITLSAHDLGELGLDGYYGHGMANVQHLYASIMDNSLSFSVYYEEFDDFIIVEMETSLPNAKIYYTTDNSYPGLDSEMCGNLAMLDYTATLRAVALVTDSNGNITHASEIETGQFICSNDVGESYFTLDANGMVCEYTGSMIDVIIPQTIQGVTVRGVAEWAFNNRAIQSITLPNSAKTIEDYAFTCCYSLKRVVANGVIKVGREAFYNCSQIETIEMAEVEEINDYAFTSSSSSNQYLTSLNMPKLKKVGREAFANFINLRELNAENIALISYHGFYGCDISEINLPNVKYIGDQAFGGNIEITTINMPNIEYIGAEVFMNLSLLQTIDISSVKFVGESAFQSCDGLNNLSLPELEIVGPYAFKFSEISSLTAPKLKTIHKQAFYGSQLTQVNIDQVEYIGDGAFNNNTQLNLVLLSNCINFMGQNCFTNKNCLYQIYGNTIAKTYLEENNLMNYQDISTDNEVLRYEIKNGEVSILGYNPDLMLDNYEVPAMINNMPVVRICKNAFKNCLLVSKVHLPYVRMIEESAFENCNNLISVELNKATTIQDNAFKGCGNLSHLKIEEIVSVGAGAFLNCENLKSVRLQGFEIYVGEKAFGFSQNGNSYTKVADFEMIVYSDSVGEEYAVQNQIEYMFFEVNSVSVFLYSTFIGDDGYEVGIKDVYTINDGELVLPSIVDDMPLTRICASAFQNCSNITKLYIPESVKVIEASAFSNCSSLQEVYAEGIIKIHESAFMDCELLKYVYTPNVEIIHKNAFSNCYNLELITTLNLISLGDSGSNSTSSYRGYVFENCNKLTEIYLPRIEYVYGECFSDSLKKAFFTNTLRIFDEKLVPNTTKVYGYNHNVLLNAISGNTFELLDENFQVSINTIGDSVSYRIGDQMYLDAVTNGYNVIYQWYVQTGSGSYSALDCEDFSQMLLKDYGVDKYYVKVAAMNWDGTISESTPVLVKVFAEDVEIYQISVEQEGLGTVSLSNNQVYAGDSVLVSIVPQEGYVLSKILINEQDAELKNLFTIIDVNQDMTIKVVFEKIKLTITVIQSSHGRIEVLEDSSLTQFVGYGENSKTYFFVADEGYQLKSIIIDGEVIGIDLSQIQIHGYIFQNVKNNHTLSAEFETIKLNVTVTTIGLDEDIFEQKIVEYGQNVEIVLTTKWNYTITAVKINNQIVSLQDIFNNVLIIRNITNNLSVVIEYEFKVYQIEFNSYQHGMVNVEYLNSFANQTQSFKITITPDEGYKVKTLSVDGVNVLNQIQNGELVVTIARDVLADIEFEKIIFTITVLQSGYGKITSMEESVIPQTEQVEYGNNSKLYYFIADAGYGLQAIIIDGERITTNLEQIAQGFMFTNVTSNHTLTAEFGVKLFNVSSEVVGVGQVILSCNIVEYGGSVVVDIINAPHSELVSIYINNEKKDNIESQFTISNITADTTIKVVFAVKLYIINVIFSDGGFVTPYGVFEVEHGENLEFSIYPDEGYKLKEFKLNGEVIQVGNLFTLENITSRNDVEVIFERIMLKLIVICDENGIVTPEGEMLVKYGDSKLLQISPNSGYGISQITINNNKIANNKNIVLSYIKEDTVVVVEFEKVYSIKTISNAGGRISESASLFKGEDKEIVIEPEVGYKIEDVIIDGVSVGSISSYVFNNVEKEHSIQVKFAKITFKITINIKGKGNVVCDESLTEVVYGESRTIQIESKDNYKLPENIILDGQETQILNGVIILNNITKNISIEIQMIEGEKEKTNIIPIIIIIATSLIVAGGVAVAVILIVKHKKKKMFTDDSSDQDEKNITKQSESLAGADNNLKPRILQQNKTIQQLNNVGNSQLGAGTLSGGNSQHNVNQQVNQVRAGVTNANGISQTQASSVNTAPRPIINQQRVAGSVQNMQQIKPQQQFNQSARMSQQGAQTARPQQAQIASPQNQIRPKLNPQTLNNNPQNQVQRSVQSPIKPGINQGLKNGNINSVNNQNAVRNININNNNLPVNKYPNKNPQDKK